MYKVDKNQDVSTSKKQRNSYPFHMMEVGDSFFMEVEAVDINKIQRKMSSICVTNGKRHQKKYITRRVDGGLRIFRVAEA